MIEGITVLNQEMIMTTPKILCAVAIVCIILGVISFSLLLTSSNGIHITIFGVITILCIIAVFIFGVLLEEESGRYRYECTIDESVSIQDIYENYDVKEQRGEIWVLEDKKKED